MEILLPIYQFLCDTQTQNKRSSVGFSWNEILKKHTFLPRIEFENMIFSKAKWNIEVAVFQKLFANKNLLASIKIWQKENLIPDFVELVEGDNKLLIDLKSEISIRMLLDTIKNRKKFILEEFLFLDNEFIKDEKDASYCNQFVVSFYNEAKLKQANNE
ncbi:lantibiotic dehydratase [Polaribacter batillariae]|uniref:Lantibiotic dehydratase n=1 Tax=Polaribacter batillariae TaxID=2808900 RepID=A0ABX7SR61_9FLAO|nr:lantibiotic dehydratase [Polaribacter batillariae]